MQPGYIYGSSVTSTSATPDQHQIRPGPVTQPQHDYTAPQPSSRRIQYPCRQSSQYRFSDLTLVSTASHGTWRDAAAADRSIWSNQRPPMSGAVKIGCSVTYHACISLLRKSRTCQEFIFASRQLQVITEVLTRNAWWSQPPMGSWEQRELAPRKSLDK